MSYICIGYHPVYIVILGDFNAHVGSDTDTWHSVLDPHGVGQVNENGQRLLHFCHQ